MHTHTSSHILTHGHSVLKKMALHSDYEKVCQWKHSRRLTNSSARRNLVSFSSLVIPVCISSPVYYHCYELVYILNAPKKDILEFQPPMTLFRDRFFMELINEVMSKISATTWCLHNKESWVTRQTCTWVGGGPWKWGTGWCIYMPRMLHTMSIPAKAERRS